MAHCYTHVVTKGNKTCFSQTKGLYSTTDCSTSVLQTGRLSHLHSNTTQQGVYQIKKKELVRQLILFLGGMFPQADDEGVDYLMEPGRVKDDTLNMYIHDSDEENVDQQCHTVSSLVYSLEAMWAIRSQTRLL